MTSNTHAQHKFSASNLLEYEVDVSSASNLALAAKKFSENGFIVLRNAVAQSLIDNIHQDLLHAIAAGLITNKARDLHRFGDGTVSSAHNLIDYLPSYQRLLGLEVVHKLLTLAFGKLSENKFNSSFFAKPRRVGLETKPHQDNAFFCLAPAEVATCWLPVTFADRSNGCLYYYPKSSSLGNLSHVADGNVGASMCLSPDALSLVQTRFNRVYVELKKGDCVIHNATIIHGSESNESDNDRNALNFSIASKKAIRDDNLYSRYKANLNSFLATRKINSSEFVR
jgi:hypothetical protein